MEGEENKQETATEKEERKEADISLKELSRRLQDFADERDWEQYHSPRNLLLAMVRNITLY
jgi:dCTP diphosphatase